MIGGRGLVDKSRAAASPVADRASPEGGSRCRALRLQCNSEKRTTQKLVLLAIASELVCMCIYIYTRLVQNMCVYVMFNDEVIKDSHAYNNKWQERELD